MTLKELCARNVSAGLREALNAANCADLDARKPDGEPREIDDATQDLLRQAAECLGGAAERLARKPPKPAEPEAVGAAAPSAGGDGAKAPRKKR